MFYHFILFSGDCADHNWLYALIEQVRDFVRDGLAGRAPVHVKAVGQYQPNLMALCRSRFYEYLSPCKNTEKSGIDHESGYRGRGYPGETGCLCFDPTRDCPGQLIYC